MKNSKGYGLFELLITLTAFSILIGYALPSFYQLRLNTIMNSERNRLTSSFHYARFTAIANQKQVILCPSFSGSSCDAQSNWHQGWIVFIDDNRNRKFDSKDTILLNEDPMKTELSVTSSAGRQKIRYNPMGFSPGTNVSINFCDERGQSYAKSLIVNNAGRVKQSSPINNNICN